MTRAKINIYTSKNSKTLLATLYSNSSAYPSNLMPLFERAFKEEYLNKVLAEIADKVDCVPVFNVSYIYDIYIEEKIAIAFDTHLNWDKGIRRKTKEVVRSTPECKYLESNERC